MKRMLGVFVLVGMLSFPAAAFAGEQIGIYVAPKFVYGLTQIEGAQGKIAWEGLGTASTGKGSQTDNTFGGSIAIGYDFSKNQGIPLRAELEYAIFSEAEAKKSYSGTDTDGGTGTYDYSERWKQTYGIQTLFLNAYYDFETGTMFTPYIGAGLGMAFIKTKGTYSGVAEVGGGYGAPLVPNGSYSLNANAGSKTVTNFAWNIGAGLGVDLTENWTLDAGYRFVSLGSVKTKTGTLELNGQSVDAITGSGKTRDLYHHQFAVGIRYTF